MSETSVGSRTLLPLADPARRADPHDAVHCAFAQYNQGKLILRSEDTVAAPIRTAHRTLARGRACWSPADAGVATDHQPMGVDGL